MKSKIHKNWNSWNLIYTRIETHDIWISRNTNSTTFFMNFITSELWISRNLNFAETETHQMWELRQFFAHFLQTWKSRDNFEIIFELCAKEWFKVFTRKSKKLLNSEFWKACTPRTGVKIRCCCWHLVRRNINYAKELLLLTSHSTAS